MTLENPILGNPVVENTILSDIIQGRDRPVTTSGTFDKARLEDLVGREGKLGEVNATFIQDAWNPDARLELGTLAHNDPTEYLGGVNERGENVEAASPDVLRSESSRFYHKSRQELSDYVAENRKDSLKPLSDEIKVELALQSNDRFYKFSKLQSSSDPQAVANMKGVLLKNDVGASYRILRADRGTIERLFSVYVDVEKSKEIQKAGLGTYEKTDKGVEFMPYASKVEDYIDEHLEKAGSDIKDKGKKAKFKAQIREDCYVNIGYNTKVALKKKED